MIEFSNGCSDPETLVVYSMFNENPHVHTLQMFVAEEEDCEGVSVGFMHYGDDIMVHFNVDTKVGEVWMMCDGLDGEYIPYGIITVDGLVELLGKLPHINQYLVDDRCAVVH